MSETERGGKKMKGRFMWLSRRKMKSRFIIFLTF